MRIFDFKNFVVNEKLGLSESSTMFREIIYKTVYSKFAEFYKSTEKSISETLIINYRKLRPQITDLKLYSDFPVVGFEVDVEFKKITSSRFTALYGDKEITVGGSSSGFGHKNWKNYSKIVKPGGKLVYATCSVLPSENEEQIKKFLNTEAGKEFTFVKEKKVLAHESGFDGFYMALLERKN